MSPERERKLETLVQILGRHAKTEGRTPTAIDGVEIFRADGPSPIRCSLYSACLILVAQGRKRARVGEDVYEYSPARYLVLPVSLPIHAQIVEARSDRPFLSFSVRVDPTLLAGVVSEVDPGKAPPRKAVRGIAVSETTGELLDAAVRLLSCLDSPADCRVLAPWIEREILYRVLLGPQGDLLRAVGSRDSRLGQVARAMAMIHSRYEQPLRVADLAREARMSESTFYEAFRSITSLSPLQYLKEVRLHRARQIVVWDGGSAQGAAQQVGYASASQFSREFKRRFGRPPSAERAWAIEQGELASVPASGARAPRGPRPPRPPGPLSEP